jgi:site-specific DNA recombinase
MLGRKSPHLASPRSRTAPSPSRSPEPPTNQVKQKEEGDIKKITPSNPELKVEPSLQKLAAGYARVSTDRHEQQESVKRQVETLQQAAAERGYELPTEFIFVDDGYSGARLDRPGLDRLRDLVSEGAIETVLCSAPDRLARQYAYQVVVLEEFKRAGCEVEFLNHAFGQSPEEQMLLQIQGVFAEYERAVIKERMRRGQLAAARQGRVNWGNPPYGYRYIRKTETTPQQLVTYEAEAVIVQQMYRWLVDEELSSYAIQKRLTEQQVPPRGANTRGWAQSSVIKLLRSPLYKGEAIYNRTQGTDVQRPYRRRSFKDQHPGNGRGRTERPRDEWIVVRVPAIIDLDLWELAQAQLARNRDKAQRNNTTHHYLLRGLLICGRCGRRLAGAWSALGGGRYVCSARYPRSQAGRCDGRSVAASRVEPLVWNYVRELLSDTELLRARYADGQGDPAVEGRDERERGRLERQLTALEREVQRLIDAYQASVIDLPELQTRRQRIEEHGQVLRQRVRELAHQRESREQQLRLLQGLDEFCASIRDALQTPSFTVKQKVLQLVVDQVIVEEQRITVRHVVPTQPIRLQPRQQP